MFEDGDFEVVDECTGEDDAPEILEKGESKEAPKPGNEGKTNGEGTPAVKAKLPGILKTSTNAASTPNKTNPVKESAAEAIDFTADISMEPESQKDDAGDDGGDVIQIDVTDTIILDTEECEDKSEAVTDVTSASEADPKTEASTEGSSVQVVEEISPENAWYEEKINGKMTIVRERLSKLARVLEFSYPAYKPWLEHYKDPVCHLEPPRRCPLTRPHSNRWKFICSRKPVQESTNKEEDSAEGTVNKKVETVWRLGPTDGSGINTDNASQYPPFVMRVVKVFEEFIQNVEITDDPEPAEPVKEEAAPAEVKAEDAAAKEVKTEDAGTTKVESEAAAPTEAPTAEAEAAAAAAQEDKPEDDENKEEASDEKESSAVDRNHNWLWLLVRSNSKDELMVFATGKKISQSTMEKLKETFETGPGKDCNVKSLYCKSISKTGTTTTTNITFLAGSEALDETVGGLKIQLAPKTNFWCNASGVEQLGAAVGDLLNPVQKFTVAEIGCGLGLIGLMQASKCRQIIGLDAPSEVEEAEMTSELNKIKNSSFVMGQPADMMAQITKLLKNTRSAAIVNANTRIGRTIEMMTALRKIPTLRRVVMITTLTKQSVRAILELTRPADGDLGNPFMPVRAVVVDTLPVGPHFEVVIRMERLTMHKMSEPWFWNHVQFRAGLSTSAQQQKQKKNDKSPKVPGTKGGVKGAGPAKISPAGQAANKRANNRANKRNKMKKQAQLKAAGQGVVVGSRIVVGPGLVTGVVKNAPKNLVKNPMASGAKNLAKNPASNAIKNQPRGKRAHSPDKTGGGNAATKKFARVNKVPNAKSGPSSKLSPDSPNLQQAANKIARPNKPKLASPLKKNPLARVPPRGAGGISGAQKRRRNWGTEVSMMRGQPLPPKRMRDNQGNHGDDLRSRLSEGRMDPVLMQQVQEQQMLLSLAQQKLSTQGPVVDVDTAKQLHNMLNIVLEQTNKLQHQLPRSNVWDRIAPIDNSGYNSPPQNQGRNEMGFRERFVQDMGQQEMLITAQNRGFMQPNQQPPGPMPLFPANRMPLDSHQVAPSGMSPMEYMRGRGMPERSQSGGGGGSGGRDFRKSQFSEGGNWQRPNQFEKNQNQNRGSQQTINKPPSLESQVVSTLRGTSPKRPLLSPPRLDVPVSRRFNAPSFQNQQQQQQSGGEMRRPQSPPRRQMSPPRRPVSPPRNSNTEIFHRRPSASQAGRQQQQQQTQVSGNQRRGVSPQRQRDAIPAARSNSPFKKFGDEWDIPNRSALEQSNWRQGQQQQPQSSVGFTNLPQSQQNLQNQQRSGDRNAQDKRWGNDRQSNTQNWDSSASNDRFRKNLEQDKWQSKEGTWMGGGGGGGGSGIGGGGGDSWSSKQSSMKPGNKDQWSQGSMNKSWGGGGGSGPSGDNWNMRGKDGYGQSNNRMDGGGWSNAKKGDKEDWSDLPEDARDPWGDDGGASGNKQRWQPAGDRGSSGNWGRDNSDKGDQNWSNKSMGSGGNWQNKGPSMGGNKPDWSNMGGQNANEQQRWMSQNDGPKKSMPQSQGNWQGNSNSGMNNWRPQGYSQGFSSQQQQRQNMFGSNNYKGGR